MKRSMDKSIIENKSDTRIEDIIRKDFDSNNVLYIGRAVTRF